MTVNEIKRYTKKDVCSYSLGSFPTFELLQAKPEVAEMILIHSDAKAEIRNKLRRECEKAGVKIIESDNHIERIREKENWYPFMLNGEYRLGTFEHPRNKLYALIFGNEASGLDASYLNVGKSVVISHTHSIDSLNLSLAAGIGIYEFCKSAI